MGVGIIDPAILMRPKFGGRRLSSVTDASAAASSVQGKSYGMYGVILIGCMAFLLTFKRRRDRKRQQVSSRQGLQVV